ncbi:MAG: thiamine phosphate synthase [Amphiplicatus sp.]
MSCRLYLVSPPAIDLAAFARAVEEALAAGDVACLQLRLKDRAGTPAPDDEILRAAETLLPIARARDVALLINDRPDLAKRAGADGAHIGQSDMSLSEARALLGDRASIGVTCHASKDLALEAGAAGADYVAFGAFYPTGTKDAPTRATPDILEWWSHATTVPCVAIGGITPDNCGALVRAGADFLAVSNAVWGAEDGPATAVKRFMAAIEAANSEFESRRIS